MILGGKDPVGSGTLPGDVEVNIFASLVLHGVCKWDAYCLMLNGSGYFLFFPFDHINFVRVHDTGQSTQECTAVHIQAFNNSYFFRSYFLRLILCHDADSVNFLPVRPSRQPNQPPLVVVAVQLIARHFPSHWNLC